MRTLNGLLTATLLAAATAPASERANCFDGLEFNAQGLRRLTLHIAPSAVRIGAARDQFVRLRCELPDGQSPTRIGIDWSTSTSSASLRVRSPHLSNQRFRLEVPRDIDLTVRLTAGEITIRGVHGSKDVELTAGQIRIDAGPPSDYSRIDASVWVGELSAPSLHTSRRGFFRSFTRNFSTGKHQLRARVGAGQITLE
ncbi:MAG: hypothetical protein J0L64_21270 [Acidobacteria bacterium]|nr:hypothetical protein [Acidobacteriota bacterium]